MTYHILLLLLLLTHISLGAKPVVQDFQQPVNVKEDPQVETKLAEIFATDSDGDAITSCDIKVSMPAGPFNVQKKGGDTRFWVYYDGLTPLNHAAVNYYELRVECTDSTGAKSNDVDLFVYVIPNTAPSITNYPGDSVTLDANTFNYVTDTAYQVMATDPDGDTISYSLVNSQPNDGLFTINSATGRITATKDLRTISEPSYILTVGVSDGKNNINDLRVFVTIDNLNTAPEIRNLPTTVSIPEDAPAGTTLITLTVEDPTQYPGPIVPTCTTTPASEGYKFQYNSADSSITLTADNLLDYETRDSYVITCTANDGFYSSGGGDILNVMVENVNEGPQFNSADYYCTLTESKQRVNFCTLPLTVTDPEGDSLDSIKFQSAPNSGKFYFDKNTNRVYFNEDYDVDNNNMPSTVDLVLETADSAGATATANVHITINDGNDNACQLDKQVSYTQITQSTAVGQLDQFTMTDADLTSPNNDVSMQLVSSSPADTTSYFTVTSSGQVFYIGTVPPANTGSSYTMLVTCTDGGTPSLTSYATVIVSYTYITTPTTTTTTTTTAGTTTTAEPEKDIWDYDWFIAVFSLLMLLSLLALIGTLAFLISRCCCQPTYTVTASKRRKVKPKPRSEPKQQKDEGNYDKKSVRSAFHSDQGDDDYFKTAARSDYNTNPHTWRNGQAPLSPRMIPSLEFK